MLEIIKADNQIVAINKPHGLLVHRTRIAEEKSEFALQLLRDQIGQKVYPTHRIDRKTSGILLFALTPEADKNIKEQLKNTTVKKNYLAIVRGYTHDKETIDYPLKKENGNLQEAITHFETLERIEIPVPFGKHNTSRYSLLSITPETGRMHQIRKHLAHISHPIIGDRPHGCNKQNRLFKEKWHMDSMLLHAYQLYFEHPESKIQVHLKAQPSTEFNRTLAFLGFDYQF